MVAAQRCGPVLIGNQCVPSATCRNRSKHVCGPRSAPLSAQWSDQVMDLSRNGSSVTPLRPLRVLGVGRRMFRRCSRRGSGTVGQRHRIHSFFRFARSFSAHHKARRETPDAFAWFSEFPSRDTATSSRTCDPFKPRNACRGFRGILSVAVPTLITFFDPATGVKIAHVRPSSSFVAQRQPEQGAQARHQRCANFRKTPAGGPAASSAMGDH